MKPLTRTFAAAAGLAVLVLAASGCDTSPYAAKVNSQVIKETTLNRELSDWAGNAQYVQAFDSAGSSSGTGISVVGDAPGTYNKQWVAFILDDVILSDLVRQRLDHLGQSSDQITVEAARAVSEISQVGWTSFSPSFRDILAQRLADIATLSPPSYDQATLRRIYQQYESYFFSRICLVQSSTFSLAAAEQLSTTKNLLGGQVCYSQADLEKQMPTLRQAVLNLPVGAVSRPIKTSYGYIVVQVQSRDPIPFGVQVQRVLSVAVVNSQGGPNPALQGLVAHAKVSVNPDFGSWSNDQVVPPKVPGSSA